MEGKGVMMDGGGRRGRTECGRKRVESGKFTVKGRGEKKRVEGGRKKGP